MYIRLASGVDKLSIEDIKSYCKDKLAYFKIPRFIKFVEDYPMTVTGKVQKFKLRQMAAEDFKED